MIILVIGEVSLRSVDTVLTLMQKSVSSQTVASLVTVVIHQPEVPPLFGTYCTNKVRVGLVS